MIARARYNKKKRDFQKKIVKKVQSSWSLFKGTKTLFLEKGHFQRDIFRPKEEKLLLKRPVYKDLTTCIK